MTTEFHLMVNVPQKSLSNFTNNMVIFHAVDNGHSFADNAKTMLSTPMLQTTTHCQVIS
jgi:hypothetical protein